MLMFLALNKVLSLNLFVILEHLTTLLTSTLNTRDELLTQKLLKQGYRYH